MSYEDLIIYAGLSAILAGGLVMIWRQERTHREQMDQLRAEHEAWQEMARIRDATHLGKWGEGKK